MTRASKELPAGPGGKSWFENAVFYKLPVKSFYDASGDGIGDFRGLTQKLDYISDLGATCVWLLPFFPSPLKDDGYDVSDYRAVHPDYGTMDDFRAFVQAAHEKGLRVAAEMVINHTSTEHPWFEAACNSPRGSPQREFYVWSDDQGGASHRADAAAKTAADPASHWTWNATAEAYYWHRFGPHQPDLNYANESVRAEMLKILRFWADLGVDGLCLTGASYLVEREGTTGEHLPETHEVLKFFRRELAAEYPELMLQAGVSAWPGESHAYIAGGDECHMVPNLAIAPRMFLSLRQESSQPLVDILRQTPAASSGSQWVTLLRNHDELTLTLATDEERDYLFQYYAADSSSRLNGGILRRLAPLAANCRRQIELLFGLLFAFPGSPVIYYGDEIGMGDNALLGSRFGIRTPMQWSPDRNGGFSQAVFERLFSPPLMDPVFGFQAVNVDAQQRDTSSLLHWMRKLIGVRKKNEVLASGTLEILEAANQKIVAFVRMPSESSPGSPHGEASDADPVLVIANLAHTAQPAELDLSRFAGLMPLEIFGRSEFPRIGDSPYLFTLGPHAFHWFRLVREAAPSLSQLAAVETEEVSQVPVIKADGGAEILSAPIREALERAVLPGFLKSQRWFGGKARKIDAIKIVDWGPFDLPGVQAFHVLLEVGFAEGQHDLYFLPLVLVEGADAVAAYQHQRRWVVARLEGPKRSAVLLDALASTAFCSKLLSTIGAAQTFSTPGGIVQAEATAAFQQLLENPADPPAPRLGPATSSNSLVFYGRRLLLKLFRRLEQGTNPDYEIGRFLTASNRFSRTPPVAGKLEWRRRDGGIFTLGILQALVPNQGDGWGHALDELGRYFARASARMFAPDALQPESRSPLELASESPSPAALETIGGYLYIARTLGRRTAQMHLALASDESDPDFAPEPIGEIDVENMREEIENQGEQAFSALAAKADRLPAAIAGDARRVLDTGPSELKRILNQWQGVPSAVKTRVHGDYHLGQVLWVDNDYVILDFEGEPTRTVEARRAKFSPLRDVAGILRSYHYAAYAGLFSFTQDRPDDLPRLAAWADLWQQWVSAAFLAEYRRVAGESSILPRDAAGLAQLLDMFVLSKALYELVYELNNRPDWVRIPLSGVMRLVARPDTATH